MTENFADLWLNKYGSTPNEENSRSWRVALTGLTKGQIDTGLKEVVLQCLEYPPVPPKFRGLCLSHDEDEKESLFSMLTKWGQLDQSERSQKGLWLVRNMKNYHYFKAFATEIQARKMFDAVYKDLQKHLADGGELPEFHVEIEHVEQPPMPMEKRSSFFADLMKAVDNPQGA